MNFPEKSHNTTDKLFTWDEVRALLDKEAMRRAEYISRILLKLANLYGDGVMETAQQVIYQIGFEKGQQRARIMQSEDKAVDLDNLAKLISHPTAQLYLGNQVSVELRQMRVTEDYCPLPRKWKEMGLPDDQIVSFCLLFDQVDKGMVEGFNPNFEAHLSGCRGLSENGFCQMIVRRK